jgi:hypothetical protein
MVVAHDPGDVMLDRFISLRGWLRGLGVCWSCQDTLAWCQVDREKSGQTVKPAQDCGTSDLCRARANAGRKSMPTPAAIAATTMEATR